jgi:hypothetical protein
MTFYEFVWNFNGRISNMARDRSSCICILPNESSTNLNRQAYEILLLQYLSCLSYLSNHPTFLVNMILKWYVCICMYAVA